MNEKEKKSASSHLAFKTENYKRKKIAGFHLKKITSENIKQVVLRAPIKSQHTVIIKHYKLIR